MKRKGWLIASAIALILAVGANGWWINREKPLTRIGETAILEKTDGYEVYWGKYEDNTIYYECNVPDETEVVYLEGEGPPYPFEGIPVPWIAYSEQSDLHEIYEKANNSIEEMFMPGVARYFRTASRIFPEVTLQNEKYLSIKLSMLWMGRRIDTGVASYSVNMETGEQLLLNDLLEISEELVELILTEGYAQFDYFKYEQADDPDYWDYKYPQKYLDLWNEEDVFRRLNDCALVFKEENGYSIFKPTFYLKEGRLYLINILAGTTDVFFVETKDLKEFLKVEPW